MEQRINLREVCFNCGHAYLFHLGTDGHFYECSMPVDEIPGVETKVCGCSKFVRQD
jgi:hypothetical protein